MFPLFTAWREIRGQRLSQTGLSEEPEVECGGNGAVGVTGRVAEMREFGDEMRARRDMADLQSACCRLGYEDAARGRGNTANRSEGTTLKPESGTPTSTEARSGMGGG